MQTFLPYANFKQVALCLDYRRLGKQRVEASQIISTIVNGSRWINHPAVKMWKNHINALSLYMNCMIEEWIRRGYINNMKIVTITHPIMYPDWLGNEDFHASHRSNLLRKKYDWYIRFGWTEPIDLDYIWPVK